MRRRPGVLIALALLVTTAMAGCGSDEDSAGSATPTAPSVTQSPSPSGGGSVPEVVEIDVSVQDGKVIPRTRRVEIERGTTVRLVVTSDVDDALHVHGYEVEADLEAGRPTTVEVLADQAGLFDVETHETELTLVQLEVR